MLHLRMVPTLNNGFGKSRSLQGQLESTKKIGVTTDLFEIISLNLNKNADISIFLKKGGIFLHALLFNQNIPFSHWLKPHT